MHIHVAGESRRHGGLAASVYFYRQLKPFISLPQASRLNVGDDVGRLLETHCENDRRVSEVPLLRAACSQHLGVCMLICTRGRGKGACARGQLTRRLLVQRWQRIWNWGTCPAVGDPCRESFAELHPGSPVCEQSVRADLRHWYGGRNPQVERKGLGLKGCLHLRVFEGEGLSTLGFSHAHP